MAASKGHTQVTRPGRRNSPALHSNLICISFYCELQRALRVGSSQQTILVCVTDSRKIKLRLLKELQVRPDTAARQLSLKSS